MDNLSDWLDRQDGLKRQEFLEALIAEAKAMGGDVDSVVATAGRSYREAKKMPPVVKFLLQKAVYSEQDFIVKALKVEMNKRTNHTNDSDYFLLDSVSALYFCARHLGSSVHSG